MLHYYYLVAARLKSRENGQAMVEYALILGLISIVAIVALTGIGTQVNRIYEAIEDALAAVTP